MSDKIDRLSPNQDDFYNALMDAHAGLDTPASHALNARLVLMMANQIGDIATLQSLLTEARTYSEN